MPAFVHARPPPPLPAADKDQAYDTSSVLDYPALRFFVAPVSTSGEEKSVVRLAGLSLLDKLPAPIKAEDFIRSRGSGSLDTLAKGALAHEYLVGLKTIENTLLEIVVEALDLRPKLTTEFSSIPSEFAGTEFATCDGKIVFRNFAAVLAAISDIHEFAFVEGARLHHQLNIAPSERATILMTLERRLSVLDILVHAAAQASGTWQQLVDLWSVKPFATPDFPPGRKPFCVSPHLDSYQSGDKVTPIVAADAVFHTVYQACGSDGADKVTLSRIRHLTLSNSYGDIFWVQDLIERAGNRTPYFQAEESAGGKTAALQSKKSSQRTTQPTDRQRSLFREIFKDLDLPLSTVFLAMCAVGEGTATRREFSQFRRHVRSACIDSSSLEIGTRSVGELFKELARSRHVPMAPIDLSSLGKARLMEFLKQLCYRKYDGDRQKMLTELDLITKQTAPAAREESVVHEILRQLAPQLAEQLRRAAQFEAPKSIRFKPLDFQVEAVAEAIHNNKWLFLMAAGTGKTETGAILTQLYKTLWLTRSSVRSNTASRLRKLIPEDQVVLDLSKLPTNTPEQFGAELARAQVVVSSYHLVRLIQKNHEEHFKALRKWIAIGLKILDEGQQIDNYESQCAATVRALESRSAVLTATPVQQHPASLASLLNIVFPDLYPDPETLKKQFTDTPSLARAHLHLHSTKISLADVTKEFVPFSQEPPAVQLASNIPRIPRLVIHRVPYTLSYEHSLAYADIATNFDAWCERRGVARRQSFHQYYRLLQLVVNPEKLGLSPPHALIAGMKHIMVPAMTQGEKVLGFAQHLHLPELLSNDEELREFGTEFLCGRHSSEHRSKVLGRLEEDSSLRCVLGQIEAIGTGFNCRGISHTIIPPDLPRLTSLLIQGLGRGQRLLTAGQEKYAKDTVEVHFMEPHLDPEAVASIPERRRRQYLDRGTIHQQWLTRSLGRVEDYREFMGAEPGFGGTLGDDVRVVVRGLSLKNAELAAERADYKLLTSDRLKDRFFHLRSKSKASWREEKLDGFVERALPLLGKAPIEVTIADLPGPECLSIPIWLKHGVGKVLGFEADDNPSVREYCRQRMTKYGCELFEREMERVLPKRQPVDGICLDTDGYLGKNLFTMLVDLEFPMRMMLGKNSWWGREDGAMVDALGRVGGDRNELDLELLKLTGTKLSNRIGSREPEKLIQARRQIASLSHTLATLLFGRETQDIETRAEMIADAVCGSRHLKDFDQSKYQTPTHRPFLSTFAVLERWNEERWEGPAAVAIRDFVDAARSRGLTSFEAPATSVNRVAGDQIVLSDARLGKYTWRFPSKDLTSLAQYYEAAVKPEFRTSALLKRYLDATCVTVAS